jgi:hypothetical protein
MLIHRTIQILILSCLLISGCTKNPFKEGSEPDGFREIKWGTDISTLQSMQYVNSEFDSEEKVDIYKKTDDELTIGGAELASIKYYFWHNKFIKADIDAYGDRNCQALKDATFEKFGEGRKGGHSKAESYKWLGDQTCIIFSYLTLINKCYLLVYSCEIQSLLRESSDQKRKNKAKEGAEKGF